MAVIVFQLALAAVLILKSESFARLAVSRDHSDEGLER
jgi:hypothetical protein